MPTLSTSKSELPSAAQASRSTETLRVELLLRRSSAQLLLSVLPQSEEQESLKQRIAACNFFLDYLEHWQLEAPPVDHRPRQQLS